MLREGFGCDSKILADLQKAVKEGRRMSIVYDLYSEGGVKEYTPDPCQLYFDRRLRREKSGVDKEFMIKDRRHGRKFRLGDNVRVNVG